MICRVCHSKIASGKPKMIMELSVKLNQMDKISYFSCLKCNNVSAFDKLDEQFHLKRYKTEKTSRYSRKRLQDFFQIRDYQQNKLNKLVSKYIIDAVSPGMHSFLEVGCAEGSLLTSLQDKVNWSIQGLEIETSRAEYARSKELSIINEPYSNYILPESSKSIISIHEALDHFNDIKSVLDTVRYHLKPGGFLTVLNTIFRWDAEKQINKFHHSTYFTHDGILNMFMINGFDVVQVYNIPLPSARERRLVNIKGHIKKIIGRKGPYFDRMWSKHLFIAQKRDSITSEKKGKPGMHWQWQKNRYKQIPA